MRRQPPPRAGRGPDQEQRVGRAYRGRGDNPEASARTASQPFGCRCESSIPGGGTPRSTP
eukprot:1745717-Lingulodinium_polyedra.AAC.1